MTQEQKEKLKNYVIMHKPVSSGDEFIRYLKNGEVIEFTGCENSANNSEYIINNNPSRKIWYSQLSEHFLTEDLDVFLTCIFFDNGEQISFANIDSCDLFNKCKGKKFRVSIPFDFSYRINRFSKIWDKNHIYLLNDMYKYIVSCAERSDYQSIGDTLKTANAYILKEI